MMMITEHWAVYPSISVQVEYNKLHGRILGYNIVVDNQNENPSCFHFHVACVRSRVNKWKWRGNIQESLKI